MNYISLKRGRRISLIVSVMVVIFLVYGFGLAPAFDFFRGDISQEAVFLEMEDRFPLILVGLLALFIARLLIHWVLDVRHANKALAVMRKQCDMEGYLLLTQGLHAHYPCMPYVIDCVYNRALAFALTGREVEARECLGEIEMCYFRNKDKSIIMWIAVYIHSVSIFLDDDELSGKYLAALAAFVGSTTKNNRYTNLAKSYYEKVLKQAELKDKRDFDGLLKYYDDQILNIPPDDLFLLSIAHFRRAEALEKLGRPSEAVGSLEYVIQNGSQLSYSTKAAELLLRATENA